MGKLIKSHTWSLILLIVLLVGSIYAVKLWKEKHPGSMTVVESQAMDMTIMKPPVGITPVATEIVKRSSFSSKVTYSGSVAAYNEQIIYPRVEGVIKNLNVYNGDKVASGQVLGVLESPEIQARVAEAKASSEAALSDIGLSKSNIGKSLSERMASGQETAAFKSDVAKAESSLQATKKIIYQREREVEAAKAEYTKWQYEIKREESLLRSGAVSQMEFDDERSQYLSAKAEYELKESSLEQAKDDVKSAEAELASKKSLYEAAKKRYSASGNSYQSSKWESKQKQALAKQAKASLAGAGIIDSYRFVKAPVAGFVGKRLVSSGQLVNSSTPILSVVQIDKVRLQVFVADKDAGKISVGQNITAMFSKFPDLKIESVVSSISPSADYASRTVLIEAIISNPGYKLFPGDSVSMEIATQNSSDALSVPLSAIIRKDGKTAVWVVKEVKSTSKEKWTCTMHPQIIRDKPGICPICKMDLTPLEISSGKRAHLVYVTLGESDSERVEVMDGLSENDEVIYKGQTYLRENDSVKSVNWTEDGPKDEGHARGVGLRFASAQPFGDENSGLVRNTLQSPQPPFAKGGFAGVPFVRKGISCAFSANDEFTGVSFSKGRFASVNGRFKENILTQNAFAVGV